MDRVAERVGDGDKETGRQWDKEIMRQGDSGNWRIGYNGIRRL